MTHNFGRLVYLLNFAVVHFPDEHKCWHLAIGYHYCIVLFKIIFQSQITQKLWNSQYKSPCYHREGTLRCLPYFLVIGFPKCGTTDLFERMKHHPEFIPSKMKELHWLSRYRFMPLFRRNSTVQIGIVSFNYLYNVLVELH